MNQASINLGLDDGSASARAVLAQTFWPLHRQCSRVEQALLRALRCLNHRVQDREQAVKRLEALQFSPQGVLAVAQLAMLLDTPESRIRLLGPESSFVSVDELDLLAALRRYSQVRRGKPSAPEMADGVPHSWHRALSDVGAALREAGVRLSQRTLPLAGRLVFEQRAIEPEEPPERRLRRAQVTAIARPAPNVVRATLAGAELRDMPEGRVASWVKLFLPDEPREGERIGRAYTIRNHRPGSAEIDVDMFLHDGGPLSAWADVATVGDELLVAGPRGGYSMANTSRWVWLAGDEAALPAIAALLEGLPPGIAASVFVELDEPVDLALLATRPDTDVRFVLRGAGSGTDPDAGDLVQLLKAASVPSGPGEVWLAAEAGVARAARAFLTTTRGLSAARIHSVGYWKHGARDHKDLAAG